MGSNQKLSSDKEYSKVVGELLPLVPLEPTKAATSISQLSQATLALIRLKDIGKYFRERELRDELSSVVFEVWSATKTQADRKTLLDQRLSKLITSLRSRIGYWRIVVPLDNLKMLKGRNVRVGSVDFSVFNERRARKTLAQIRASLLKNPSYASNGKFIEQYMKSRKEGVVGPLVGKTCAETEVFGRADEAFDDGLPKIDEAIAALKLFHYLNDDFYGRYFGVSGRIVGRVRRVMLGYPRGTGFVGFESEWMGPRSEFELDRDRLRFMRANGLPRLNKILAKEKRNNAEDRIVSAALWFAKAVDVILTDKARIEPSIEISLAKGQTKRPQAEMMAPYDRLVKLTVALESLLILDEREPISSNLADRTALLLAKKYPERKAIFEFVKRMYRKRSDVVHHGGKDISGNELQQLTYLVQRAIITLVKSVEREGLGSKESLQEWFLRKKLS
jgi:hypothetical protein